MVVGMVQEIKDKELRRRVGDEEVKNVWFKKGRGTEVGWGKSNREMAMEQ